MDPALRHEEGSVGPPQFDAVVGHASKNLGVWLAVVLQLQCALILNSQLTNSTKVQNA